LWFSWNRTRRTDPVDAMLTGPTPPTGAVVVKANWRDNPWFPAVLEQERLDCLRSTPEQYPHIWDGEYATVLSGAYFARHLTDAKNEGRICALHADPLLTLRAFVDIGGTGATADTFCIWIVQFVGREIYVLDYYEAQGQPIGTHLAWMRERGYTPDRCQFWLPHDGKTQDRVYDVSYESALKGAGYAVTVVPNQGRGAASARIEAARNRFGMMLFDEKRTEAGRAALGWYHEKRDEVRGIGLGPEHDWASHAADAFGLACIAYEPPQKPADLSIIYGGRFGAGTSQGSWLG
jgi:phage terminase large subunit